MNFDPWRRQAPKSNSQTVLNDENTPLDDAIDKTPATTFVPPPFRSPSSTPRCKRYPRRSSSFGLRPLAFAWRFHWAWPASW